MTYSTIADKIEAASLSVHRGMYHGIQAAKNDIAATWQQIKNLNDEQFGLFLAEEMIKMGTNEPDAIVGQAQIVLALVMISIEGGETTSFDKQKKELQEIADKLRNAVK